MYYCANYSPDENKIEKRTLRVFRAAASEQTLTGMEFLPDGALIDKVGTYDEYLQSDAMAKKRQVYKVSEEEEEDD